MLCASRSQCCSLLLLVVVAPKQATTKALASIDRFLIPILAHLPAAMRMADERRASGAGAMKAEAVQAREARDRRLSFMVVWALGLR